MTPVRLSLFFVVLLFLFSQSYSQEVLWSDSNQVVSKSKINKIGWLEGNWKSKGEEITVQESWTRNGAHSIMGVASIYEAAKIILFEICTITEEEGTLVLRIRHFSDQLEAWEEKNAPLEKVLIKIEKDRYYFDGYTFEKNSKDQMTLYIQSKKEDQLLTIPYVRI